MEIVATAPGRCGLLGNPTDMYGGAVLSCTTQERAQCRLTPADVLTLTNDGEHTSLTRADDLALRGDKLDIARAALTFFALDPADCRFALQLATDLPMRAGLAGSTALLAAIVGALDAHLGLHLHPYALAETVRKIEAQTLGIVCGFQDQHMAVFGGLNYMDFRGKESLEQRDDEPFAIVEPLALPNPHPRLRLSLPDSRRFARREGGARSEMFHLDSGLGWANSDPDSGPSPTISEKTGSTESMSGLTQNGSTVALAPPSRRSEASESGKGAGGLGSSGFLLAHTGVQHHSGTVHATPRQRWLAGEPLVRDHYARIAALTPMGKRALLTGDWPRFGALMNENHALVRELGGSGPDNERLIEAAQRAGAWGAKLAGAGGGGTILVLTDNTDRMAQALTDAGAHRLLVPHPMPGLTLTVDDAT